MNIISQENSNMCIKKRKMEQIKYINYDLKILLICFLYRFQFSDVHLTAKCRTVDRELIVDLNLQTRIL